MELTRDIQGLIERAWALHHGLTNEIKNSDYFCKLCSEHGRYCDVGKTTFYEMERLIAMRDSLKQVWDMLLHLQRLKSWQLIDRQAAIARLEESRLILIENVTQYQGRPLDVLEELKACFSDGKTAFYRDSNEKGKNAVESNADRDKRRRVTGFLFCCSRMLLNPWKWQKAVVFAAKLILVSASITSTLHFCHARQHYRRSQTRAVGFEKSTDAVREDTILSLSLSAGPPDVFSGRG